jgi:hypothetical protein
MTARSFTWSGPFSEWYGMTGEARSAVWRWLRADATRNVPPGQQVVDESHCARDEAADVDMDDVYRDRRRSIPEPVAHRWVELDTA